MSDLYECTARTLATPDPETQSVQTSVGDAIKWFRDTGFDYAPVVNGVDPIGYVGLESLHEEADDDRLGDVHSEIEFGHVISADANFSDLLSGLREQPFYLLGGMNRVTGILTRADLNTSPARIHLFDRISLLETELRTLIEETVPNWVDTTPLGEETAGRIEERHEAAAHANIELGKIHYAGFAALSTVVAHHDECRTACGFRTESEAVDQLDAIRALRNDVAHSNLILQTTSDEFLTEGRSVGKLIAVYGDLSDCIRSLRD